MCTCKRYTITTLENLFVTAPRTLMHTYQKILQECHKLKYYAHTCAILWHCELSPCSFVVKEEQRLKRKQNQERNTVCGVPLTYWKFLFVTFWTANQSCKAKVCIAVKCTIYFTMYAWNQCWLPNNGQLHNPCKAVIWKESWFSKYNILELKDLSWILGS